jgi:TM2 domain-containing membrane protein YozV
MAGLCAFIFPGLGHLILGKPGQAALWCVGIIIGYIMLIVPGIILHIISIVHAAQLDRKQQAETITRAMRGSRPHQPDSWEQPENWKPRR